LTLSLFVIAGKSKLQQKGDDEEAVDGSDDAVRADHPPSSDTVDISETVAPSRHVTEEL